MEQSEHRAELDAERVPGELRRGPRPRSYRSTCQARSRSGASSEIDIRVWIRPSAAHENPAFSHPLAHLKGNARIPTGVSYLVTVLGPPDTVVG